MKAHCPKCGSTDVKALLEYQDYICIPIKDAENPKDIILSISKENILAIQKDILDPDNWETANIIRCSSCNWHPPHDWYEYRDIKSPLDFLDWRES
jgi:hypothetical protein